MAAGPETLGKVKPTSEGNSAVSGFGFWANGSKEALERWAQLNTDIMKGAADLSQEILALSQDRFQANVDGWKALTECRNPADFFECQKKYAEKATAQCIDETNKITSRIMSFVTAATAHFPQGPVMKS